MVGLEVGQGVKDGCVEPIEDFSDLEDREVNESNVVSDSESMSSKDSIQLLKKRENLLIEVLSAMLSVLILWEEDHKFKEVFSEIFVDTPNLGNSNLFLSSCSKEFLSVGLVDCINEESS